MERINHDDTKKLIDAMERDWKQPQEDPQKRNIQHQENRSVEADWHHLLKHQLAQEHQQQQEEQQQQQDQPISLDWTVHQ